MEGFALEAPRERIPRLASFSRRYDTLLQWKPKTMVLVAILVLAAALLGQFTWDSVDQFTWL